MTPTVINATNVNHALRDGLNWLKVAGVKEHSRNGPVLRAPGPVLTVYKYPRERVLFHPLRHANPFFHLMEALWMLAGYNDVAFVSQFVKRMKDFSDNGLTLHAAYGFRWREHFARDQLDEVVAKLRADLTSRRAVIGMFDPYVDATYQGKDLPCNTHAYFEVCQQTGALDMTVCCRSNDVIWGAYGANAVHFSILQEYLAARIGVPVGVYCQFSNNFHLYLETHGALMEKLVVDHPSYHAYDSPSVMPTPLVTTPSQWDEQLALFMRAADPVNYVAMPTFTEPFFQHVAGPMYSAWRFHKKGFHSDALLAAMEIGASASDWRKACFEWLERTYAGQIEETR